MWRVCLYALGHVSVSSEGQHSLVWSEDADVQLHKPPGPADGTAAGPAASPPGRRAALQGAPGALPGTAGTAGRALCATSAWEVAFDSLLK